MTARIDKAALIGWRGCSYLEVEMDKWSMTGLQGGSGAGKSTIGMCLCFALLPDNRTLNVRPISDVEDTHQAGIDPLAARIDPEVGFGYVVLDITSNNAKRIVVGIHVRVVDGRADVTRFHIEDAPRTESLQDLLRIVEGDEEIYPDFTVLRTALAKRGLTMREFRTVNEYGELLFDAGILPCDLKDQNDRTLYAKLLESAFRGGLSRDVSRNLKQYMLPAASRIPESVRRLEGCVQTVLRTQNALNESQRQLRLLETTLGLGKRVVTRSIQDVVTRKDRSQGLITELSAQTTALAEGITSLNGEITNVKTDIDISEEAKQNITAAFKTTIDSFADSQNDWSARKITTAQEHRDAKARLTGFEKGRQEWKRLAGDDWIEHDKEALLTKLELIQGHLKTEELELNSEQEAKIQRRAQLQAGLKDSTAGALGDALGAATLAEELDNASADDALAMEMALSGLVDGVAGVELEALAKLEDSAELPDTFWMLKKIPPAPQIHQIGPWRAVATSTGYLVTSERRKLTLGRHAREAEIASINQRLTQIETRLLKIKDGAEKVKNRRDALLKADEVISNYFELRHHEQQLRDDVDQAKAREEEADTQWKKAFENVRTASQERDKKIGLIEQKIGEFKTKQTGLEQRNQENKATLTVKSKELETQSTALVNAKEQIERMRDELGQSYEWMAKEASELTAITHDYYISKQAKDIAELGRELSDEPAQRLPWLGQLETTDPVSCCTLWKPLTTIVSERINVDILDQESTDLIANMASKRNSLSIDLDRGRAEMRAEAGTLYNVISGEVRKQESRIKKLSLFGESLKFGNVTGMRIRPSQREELLTHLLNITKQIDMFAGNNGVALEDQLSELFAKALKIKMDGSALLDYRTYIDLAIEACRNGKWEPASGLSGGESIGGGLAVSLMLARSLSQRASEGKPRSFTPFFVVDEVQRLNGPGQAVIADFGKKQGMQVLVTAISLDVSYDCTIYTLSRTSTPTEKIVMRRQIIDTALATHA